MNVVITGASRGIGKAIAEIFAANGHNLYLCSLSEVRLYGTMDELTTTYPGITVKAKPFDLSKKIQAQAFGDWCLHNASTVDTLVNNAGSFTGGNTHNEEDGSLEEMIETNLYSAYHLTRILLPAMMKKKVRAYF